MTPEQIERLFTTLGTMHQKLDDLSTANEHTQEEVAENRSEIQQLKQREQRHIGWVSGVGAVLGLLLIILEIF